MIKICFFDLLFFFKCFLLLYLSSLSLENSFLGFFTFTCSLSFFNCSWIFLSSSAFCKSTLILCCIFLLILKVFTSKLSSIASNLTLSVFFWILYFFSLLASPLLVLLFSLLRIVYFGWFYLEYLYYF